MTPLFSLDDKYRGPDYENFHRILFSSLALPEINGSRPVINDDAVSFELIGCSSCTDKHGLTCFLIEYLVMLLQNHNSS
jgi:hypothetical protein